MRPLTYSLPPEDTFPAASRRPGAAGPRHALLALVAALAVAGGPAQAEKADRGKPMSVTSSGTNPDTIDLRKHSAAFTGNVVITQGTLEIHADRVEVSQDPDGGQLGYAFGSPGKPATFRQKRDGEDEYSEGDAQRIEYDSAANRVRFVGDAHLRMLKGSTVTDTAEASLITYDTAAETVKLTGDGSTANAATTQKTTAGRTTITFTPKAASAPRQLPPLELSTPASGSGK